MALSVKTATAELLPALESNKSGSRTPYTPWKSRVVRQVSSVGSCKFARKTTALSARKCALAAVLISLATAFLLSKCFEYVSHGRFMKGGPRSLATRSSHTGISCQSQLTGSSGESGSSSVAQPSEPDSSIDATGAASSGANESVEPHRSSKKRLRSRWGFFKMPRDHQAQAVDMLHRISKLTGKCRSLVTRISADSRIRLSKHMSVVVCVEITALAFVPHALQDDRKRAGENCIALVDDVLALNAAEEGSKPALKELAKYKEFLRRLINVPKRTPTRNPIPFRKGAQIQRVLTSETLHEVAQLLESMVEAVKNHHELSAGVLELELRVLEAIGRTRKLQLLRNSFCKSWLHENQQRMTDWTFYTPEEDSYYSGECPPSQPSQLLECKTAIFAAVRAGATEYPQAAAVLLQRLGAPFLPAAPGMPPAVDTATQMPAAATSPSLLTAALPATWPAGNRRRRRTAPALAHPQGGAIQWPPLWVQHGPDGFQQPAQYVPHAHLAGSVVVNGPLSTFVPHLLLQPYNEASGTSPGPGLDGGFAGEGGFQQPAQYVPPAHLAGSVVLNGPLSASDPHVLLQPDEEASGTPPAHGISVMPLLQHFGQQAAGGSSYLQWSKLDAEEGNLESTVGHGTGEGTSREELYLWWEALDDEAENSERAVAHSTVEDRGASSSSGHADSGAVGGGSAAYPGEEDNLDVEHLIRAWKLENHLDGSGFGADGKLGN